MVPNSFGWQPSQKGSFSHFPSVIKRYSYLPGVKGRVIFHTPCSSFFSGCELGFHWLKFPAIKTLCAWGAGKLNSMSFSFLITFAFPFTAGFIDHLPVRVAAMTATLIPISVSMFISLQLDFRASRNIFRRFAGLSLLLFAAGQNLFRLLASLREMTIGFLL
jgi:hypothetical protein